MSFRLEARLPDGRALPRECAPGLYPRWDWLRHVWTDEDPVAHAVRLESHIVERAGDFPDWFLLASVDEHPIIEPLPYTLILDPAHEPELRAFIRRARFGIGVWPPGGAAVVPRGLRLPWAGS